MLRPPLGGLRAPLRPLPTSFVSPAFPLIIFTLGITSD